MADVIEIDADVYENETLTASVDMDFAYHSGVEDVRVNNSSVVIAGVANINDFSGGSPTSANNKNGLVPKPPTLQESGQWHILSDIGWKEAYPQQDNTIPWARKNTADVGASDVKAYGYDEDADPSWGWHSVVDNRGVAKLPYGNEEHYGGVMLHHDESGVTDTEWLELNWVDVDNSGMEDYIPLLDGTTHLLDAGYLPEASTTKKGAMSAADKTKLNGIPSTAEENQNAFSKFRVTTPSGERDLDATGKSARLRIQPSHGIELRTSGTYLQPNDILLIGCTGAVLFEATTYIDAGDTSARLGISEDLADHDVLVSYTAYRYIDDERYKQVIIDVEQVYDAATDWWGYEFSIASAIQDDIQIWGLFDYSA